MCNKYETMHKKIEEIKPTESRKVNYNSIKSIKNYEKKNQPVYDHHGESRGQNFSRHSIARHDMNFPMYLFSQLLGS